MNLDHELRQALKRREPPLGFSEGVLERIKTAGKSAPIPIQPRRRRWLALPIAASLAVAIGWGYHAQLQRQSEAQRAAYEVTRALHIAGEKLAGVQQKVYELNSR
jgi:hypothetical protein